MPPYCEFHLCYWDRCSELLHPTGYIVTPEVVRFSEYEKAAKKVTKQFVNGQISATDLAAKMCELYIKHEGE